MDAYTGKLAVHMPYDSVRGYFVEALLVISILVITRLSFIRNVTYKMSFNTNNTNGNAKPIGSSK